MADDPQQSSSGTSHRPSQVTVPPAQPSEPLSAHNKEGFFPSPHPDRRLSLNTSSAAVEDSAPMPVRHPKPITVADIHSQLEREQEAIVNRLSRELTLLRQQTSSVVSTSSSRSGTFADADASTSGTTLGPAAPTTTRSRRSSSSLSGQGVGLSGAATSQPVSSIAPPRESARPVPAARYAGRDGLGSRRSEASSPMATSFHAGEQQLSTSASSAAASSMRLHVGDAQQHSSVSASPTHAPHRHSRRTSSVSSQRLDELAFHKAELESARKENEALRRRVQELERQLSDKSKAAQPPPAS